MKIRGWRSRRAQPRYVRVSSRKGRIVGVVLTVAIVSGILGGTAIYGVRWVDRQITPESAPGTKIVVTVPRGSNAHDVAALLERSRVISSSTVFDWYVRIKKPGTFQAGDYTFNVNQPFDQVLKVLKTGPVQRFKKITFPEGLTLVQTVIRGGKDMPRSSAKDWFEAAISGRVRSRYQPAAQGSLEGLLFPDTYQLSDVDTAETLMTRMTNQMDEVARSLGIETGAAKLNLSPYQVLIVASLIEREAKVEDDRGKIARVIYNRLAVQQNLEIDASVIYGTGREVASLTQTDLDTDTPYNLYLHGGLPPTPIAMPGKASMKAALNPTAGTWKYYVVIDSTGRHAFADTFEEHQANIAQARAAGVIK